MRAVKGVAGVQGAGGTSASCTVEAPVRNGGGRQGCTRPARRWGTTGNKRSATCTSCGARTGIGICRGISSFQLALADADAVRRVAGRPPVGAAGRVAVAGPAGASCGPRSDRAVPLKAARGANRARSPSEDSASPPPLLVAAGRAEEPDAGSPAPAPKKKTQRSAPFQAQERALQEKKQS